MNIVKPAAATPPLSPDLVARFRAVVGDKYAVTDATDIAPYLTEAESDIADHLIESLKEVRPVLFDLIAQGDNNSYEWWLIHDWQEGRFSHQSE